jgi:hypothetical protein
MIDTNAQYLNNNHLRECSINEFDYQMHQE